MGLADAVRARLALARGESFGETIRIMFASKEERRKIAARKFPGRGVPTAADRWTIPEVPQAAVAEVLDPAWYAGVHGLKASEAVAHFRTRGLAAGFSPREALAGPDGRRLSGRGAESLCRLGLPLGAVAGEPAAQASDPWNIRNPERKPLAVVTAVATPGDRLLPAAPEWAGGADFYVVSDLSFADPGLWQPVRPVFHHLEPVRVAAFTQAHLHTFFGAYSRVLWVDPGVLLCSDPAALANGPSLACFREDGRTIEAALASLGEEAADVAAELAGHPALGLTGLFDPSVLLIDPVDAGVAAFMARWWRHAMRGLASGGFPFTLAAAEMPEVAVGELPGRSLDRSQDFVRCVG
jgi:hypothetical protein